MKYAAYKSSGEWLFDLEADSEAEALEKAKASNPESETIKLISVSDHGGRGD